MFGTDVCVYCVQVLTDPLPPRPGREKLEFVPDVDPPEAADDDVGGT